MNRKTMNKRLKLPHANPCRWLATGALCLGLASTAWAQPESKTINDGWRFLKGECAAAADSAFNDGGWTPVSLPHTWNADSYTVKDYYQGPAWYRRTVNIPQDWDGKQILLHLEGVSKAATVHVNGHRAGEHAGGYTACTFDLTPYLHPGVQNVLAIRADNGRPDIAPISADFTFFGGIYRDVWLTALPAQHFNRLNLGSDGIFISTPQVSAEEATLAIRGEVRNTAPDKASLVLTHTIYAPDGSPVQTLEQSLRLKPGETLAFQTQSKTIHNPHLWTPETPNLYRVETQLRDRKTHALLDRQDHYAGFRWFSFDGSRGFQLNGKPYKLRGICRHQDQKPVGPALSDEMHRRDMLLAKEMGANFIRISHYPQDDAILEMCDRLGMLAWEEIPVINLVPDTPGFDDNCEQNLREMIRQHYNHPSVILWGYMNEILLRTDMKDRAAVDRALNLARRLEQVLREEDPTRLSTMAFHGSNAYNETGLSEVTDVVGWNLYNGWYGGDLGGFEKFLAAQHKQYPRHPMIVSEYGAGSDKRIHTLRPRPFDFSSEYQQTYLEHYLPVLEETPYVCGGSHWNFVDFGSAVRDESMPRINNKGLLYADRTPKDVYHYYRAAWREDVPVLHIASRDWNRRAGVQSAPGQPVVQPVKVYTNLKEVELFVDGQSIGKQPVQNFNAVFQVPFSRSGEPLLTARGTADDGQEVQDAVRIHFTLVPARLDERNLEGLELAVNVGSHCFFTSDVSNLTWVPDQPYTPGSWGHIGGKATSTNTEIVGTPDNPLFQTLQAGIEGYRFDLPQGTYEVELLFADIFRATQASAYLLGSDKGQEDSNSRFTITANGRVLEAGFAPGSENGHFRAIRRKYIIHNDGDGIELRFRAESGKTFLGGIKLRRL